MAWAKNTQGKPDVMLTLTLASFSLAGGLTIFVVAAVTLGILNPEQVSSLADFIQVVGIPALLGSSGGYAFRRYTGARYGQGTYVPPEEQ